MNVFHFEGADNDLVHADIRDAIRTFYTALSSRLSLGWTLTTIKTYLVTGQGALVVAAPRTTSLETLSGTANATNLPNEVALVVSWGTLTPGRSGRGRTYLAGWVETSSNGASTTPSRPTVVVTDQVASAASGLAGVNGGATLVVFSQKNGTVATVTGGYVNNEWDTQRRRARSLAIGKTNFIA